MKLFCNITNYQNNPHYDLGFVSIVLLETNEIRKLRITLNILPNVLWFKSNKLIKVHTFKNMV